MNARGTGTRYLLAALVATALAIGAMGCSSDSKSDNSSTTQAGPTATRTDTGTSEADLKKAAGALAALSLRSGADSYAYLSGSCQEKFSSTEWATNMRQIVEGIAAALPAVATAKVGDVTVRSVTPVSGEAQVVILDASGAPLIGADKAAWSDWVVEDGKWVTNTCASAKDLLTGG